MAAEQLAFPRTCPSCGKLGDGDVDSLLDAGWAWVMGRDTTGPRELVVYKVLVCPSCNPVWRSASRTDVAAQGG